MEHHKQVTELAARIIEVIDSEDHLLIEESGNIGAGLFHHSADHGGGGASGPRRHRLQAYP
jgi:hypothetical protein